MPTNSNRRPTAATNTFPAVAVGAAACGPSADSLSSRAQPRGCAAPDQKAQQAQAGGMVLAGTTYLLGLGEQSDDPASPAMLRVGARLLLCRRSRTGPRAGAERNCVQVRTLAGHLVGQLPPDDAEAVAPLLDAGVSVTARVSALVPAFRRQRVQLTVEFERAACAQAPARSAA